MRCSVTLFECSDAIGRHFLTADRWFQCSACIYSCSISWDFSSRLGWWPPMTLDVQAPWRVQALIPVISTLICALAHVWKYFQTWSVWYKYTAKVLHPVRQNLDNSWSAVTEWIPHSGIVLHHSHIDIYKLDFCSQSISEMNLLTLIVYL